MGRRERYHLAAALWLAGFFGFGSLVWRLMAGHLMVILYLAAGLVAYGIIAFRSRCGSCGRPLLLKPVPFLGMGLYRWTLLMPRACRHCGQPL